MIIPTRNATGSSRQRFSIASNVEEEEEEVCDDTSRSNDVESATKVLYVATFIAKFAELGWEFCSTLVLVALTNYKSMILVSSYGLFTGFAICVFGPLVSSIIDDTDRNRLSVALLFNSFQKLSIIVQGVCCFFLMMSIPSDVTLETSESLAPPSNLITWVLLVAIHLFGAFESLTSQSLSIAMECDWIVVMSKVMGDRTEDHSSSESLQGSSEDENVYGHQQENELDQQLQPEFLDTTTLHSSGEENHQNLENTIPEKISWLTNTNTILKQIDLACKVATPIVFGFILSHIDGYTPSSTDAVPQSHWIDLSIIVLLSGFTTLIALFVATRMFQQTYKLVPVLALRNCSEDNAEIDASSSVCMNEESSSFETNEDQVSSSLHERISACCQIRVFLEQPMSYAGISYSLLWINVLCFGSLMTAYLVFKGMNFGTIGFLKGVSYSMGLVGTIAYGFSNRHFSLIQTGRWSVSWQFSCLILSFVSLFIPDTNVSLALLITGVIASRIGLYVFDLTIRQLMQETIPEHLRGVVWGIQNSLNYVFELIMFFLGLLYSTPEDFHILATTGFVSVGVAMSLYMWGSRYRCYMNANHAIPRHSSLEGGGSGAAAHEVNQLRESNLEIT